MNIFATNMYKKTKNKQTKNKNTLQLKTTKNQCQILHFTNISHTQTIPFLTVNCLKNTKKTYQHQKLTTTPTTRQ